MKIPISIFLILLVVGFAVGALSPQTIAGMIGSMIPGTGVAVSKGLGGLKGGGSGGVAGGKPPK